MGLQMLPDEQEWRTTKAPLQLPYTGVGSFFYLIQPDHFMKNKTKTEVDFLSPWSSPGTKIKWTKKQDIGLWTSTATHYVFPNIKRVISCYETPQRSIKSAILYQYIVEEPLGKETSSREERKLKRQSRQTGDDEELLENPAKKSKTSHSEVTSDEQKSIKHRIITEKTTTEAQHVQSGQASTLKAEEETFSSFGEPASPGLVPIEALIGPANSEAQTEAPRMEVIAKTEEPDLSVTAPSIASNVGATPLVLATPLPAQDHNMLQHPTLQWLEQMIAEVHAQSSPRSSPEEIMNCMGKMVALAKLKREAENDLAAVLCKAKKDAELILKKK